MKKIKFFPLVIAVVFSLISLCGCNDDDEFDGAGHSFTYTLYGNPQNLDPQLAEDRSSLMVIKNMFLGLMTTGLEGELCYGVAVNHHMSDDGLTYSFTLRDDCHWYSNDGTDMIVTAHDFVYAFKRIFNPVNRSPYREKFSFLKNARAIIDGQMDYSELGVYAVNNTELVFLLEEPNSEFLYLLTTSPAMPCNRQFFESTKARYGLDDESVISNGAFYMTQWSYDPYGNDNLIYMKRNYDNSAYDRVYPYMLTFIIERNVSALAENFENSETELLVSENARKKTFMDIYNTEDYETISAGIIFNSKYNVDEKIKKALSLSVERDELAALDSENLNAAYAIVPGSMTYAGVNYREYNPDREYQFYSEEIPEISESMKEDFYRTCPDNIRILVRNKSDSGLLGRVVEDWQENLGLYISIEYAEDDEYYSRLENGDYFMAFIEVTSEDSTVYYFLNNFVNSVLYGYKAQSIMNILEESVILSDKYEINDLYRKAENEILNSCEYIPLFYKRIFLIRRKSAKDIIFSPFSGQLDFRYAKFFE